LPRIGDIHRSEERDVPRGAALTRHWRGGPRCGVAAVERAYEQRRALRRMRRVIAERFAALRRGVAIGDAGRERAEGTGERVGGEKERIQQHWRIQR